MDLYLVYRISTSLWCSVFLDHITSIVEYCVHVIEA